MIKYSVLRLREREREKEDVYVNSSIRSFARRKKKADECVEHM